VETEEVIKKSPSLTRLVEEAKWYNLLQSGRIELQSALTRQRKIASDIKVVISRHQLIKKKKVFFFYEFFLLEAIFSSRLIWFLGCVSNLQQRSFSV